MSKRMLLDATHAEETRVVVLDGNRLEDFDVETSTKKQLKGNIYLAKVVRVEPSLQAAFVEYGGGRHGFLAFGEIHPDYYQIPVADRERLLAMQAEEARLEAEAEDRQARAAAARPATRQAGARPGPEAEPEAAQGDAESFAVEFGRVTEHAFEEERNAPAGGVSEEPDRAAEGEAEAEDEAAAETVEAAAEDGDDESLDAEEVAADLPPPETIGGEGDVFEGNGAEEARQRRASRLLRNYRIQEVIHRRQIMLVQVVKEERGTKGAALTTYISLAGRFCVLMPNSPRGGGISRKITSAADRRRLKEITAELEIPQGMGLIVRTAGANRPKPEIKRDCEYLMRLWDDIREHTLKSVAPALIYEEASLIKRAIRDGYSRDIDEVLVDGTEGWKAAHDFMRMLMPSHARKVIQWRPEQNGGQSLFARMGVEAQLDAMLSPTVQLKSGGYLVINQAEALVAIDVNSGRSTRERNIEETALRTNLEAAEEAARQLRLRDLAGLIVIDFIDMESKKHNAMVERRLKEALKNDRARIQVGHISHFGLLEMSRQRLRPSLTETNFVTCPHCGGLGHVRSVESSAMHVLRAIEEEGAKLRSAQVVVHVAGVVAMYLLNHKRDRLADIEARTGMVVHFAADDSLIGPQLRIERVRALEPGERPAPVVPVAPAPLPVAEEAEEEAVAEEEGEEAGAEGRGEEEDGDRRRRRRRRRRGRREEGEGEAEAPAPATPLSEEAPEGEAEEPVAATGVDLAGAEQPEIEEGALDAEGRPRARRRGRRGGRRRRREEGGVESPQAEEAAEPVAPAVPAYVAPAYAGPTPADPFGGQGFVDIFDMIEQAEERQSVAPPVVAAEPEAAPAPLAASAPVIEPAREAAGEAEAAAEPEPEVTPAALATGAEEPPVAEAKPEPVAGPAVRPIVIGQDTIPEVPRKRGWWRR